MTIANTTIQIRKSGVTGNVPSSLNLGELALNYVDGKLYYKNALGQVAYFYGANNGPSFSTAVANGTTISATAPNDILTINSSNGISITSCTSTKTMTFGYGPNSYFPSIATVNYTGSGGSQNAAFVVTGANTKGGVGYVDFLQANNQSSGSANTSKWFRIDNAGTYQIINSAYTQNIFNLTDTGTLTVPNMSSLTLTQGAGGSITFADGTTQATAAGGAATDAYARNTANNALANTGSLVTSNTVTQYVIGNTTTSTSNSTGALVIKGGMGVQGNVFSSNISVLNDIVAGTQDGNPLGGATNPIISSIGNSNNYIQTYIINYANGTQSSSDFVSYPNNGTDSSGWVDMGITSQAFSQGAFSVTTGNEGYLFMSAPAGSGTSGNLVIATDATGTYNSMEFYVGGFNSSKGTADLVIRNISNSTSTTNGSIQITGGLAVVGNTYSSNVYTNGIFYAANGLPFVTGSSGATITNDTTTSNTHYILFTTQTSGSLTVSNTSNAGLTFVPSTGTLGATVFQSLSDKNQKTNIKIIDNAMTITENLRGVTFDWKDNGLPSAGLIAQDVEKWLPELINTNGENKTLNYNGIIGVLVEAIKELNQRVKELESTQ